MAIFHFFLTACVSALAVWLTQLRHPSRRVFIALFSLLCPALYFWWIFRHSTNIPAHDDYYVFLSYMNIDWPHRLYWLFSPNNEHPVVIARLLAEFSNLALGHVNIKFIVVAGNAALLGVFALYAGELRRHRVPMRYLPALSIALFAPAAWTNMVWATSAGQNYAACFLAFLTAALFLSAKGILGRVCALAAAVCASFASAAGILIFPALIATLIARDAGQPSAAPPGKAPRRALDCLALFLCMVAIAWAYYSGILYVQTGVGKDLGDSVAAAAVNPLTIVCHFIMVLGSLTGEEYSALLLGFVCLFLAGLFTAFQGFRKSPLLCAMALFIFLSAAATAVGRAKFGAAQALEPRYRILSILLLTTYLALCLRIFPQVFRRRAVYFLILFALMFNFSWWSSKSLPLIRAHRRDLISETALLLANKRGLGGAKESTHHGAIIFGLAVDKGLYRIPDEVLEEAERKIRKAE
jgi:hypothetical protein